MIRFKVKERIADKAFKEGRKVTVAEVAEDTGIHRMTLSRMTNQKGYNAKTEILDKLCKYFECDVQDLAEYIEDDEE